MPAAYDFYDYPFYWEGRDYEHLSEVHAITSFLRKIPKSDTTLEIGVGYGRLVPVYLGHTKRVIVSDPSSRLLKIARGRLSSSKITFIHGKGEILSKKIKPHSIDLIINVRVMHHIQDPQSCIVRMQELLKPKGFLILEFANKSHALASLREFLKGNLTYSLDLSHKDVRSTRSIRKNTISFNNFHPAKIENLLLQAGFKIIEKRSVSNLRNGLLKRIFPLSILLLIEKMLQKPLSRLDFGPSVFVLAQKKK